MSDFLPYFNIEFVNLFVNFSEFNLDPQLMEGLNSMGFETATPIQEKAIPVIMSGAKT